MNKHANEYKNKSFARRIGKSLSQNQKRFLYENLANYRFMNEDINSFKSFYLEIGFGMGENLLGIARANPDKFFVGSDVYINGVNKVIKGIISSNIENLKVWDDDVNTLLENLKLNSLEGVYVLFPDPWHKRRHNKRRLLNKAMLDRLVSLMKKEAVLIFASDNLDYFQQVQDMTRSMCNLKPTICKDTLGYVKTKYHRKAEDCKATCKFLYMKKCC